PPRAVAPQSTRRAPESRVSTEIPSASASAASMSTSSAARSFIDKLIRALLSVEHKDLAAAELGPVARPACAHSSDERLLDEKPQLARTQQLHPQRRRPVARGERIAGQELDRRSRDEAAALVAESRLRADPTQRDHGTREHPQPGAAPRLPG